jgi:DNA topoisomerase-1
VTAKDFRTWRGTRTAFDYLRGHLDDEPQPAMVAAVDAAAEQLHNTRTVAREHYVHPDIVATFAAGTFAEHLTAVRPRTRAALLEPDEQLLEGFLHVLLQAERNVGADAQPAALAPVVSISAKATRPAVRNGRRKEPASSSRG